MRVSSILVLVLERKERRYINPLIIEMIFFLGLKYINE